MKLQNIKTYIIKIDFKWGSTSSLHLSSPKNLQFICILTVIQEIQKWLKLPVIYIIITNICYKLRVFYKKINNYLYLYLVSFQVRMVQIEYVGWNNLPVSNHFGLGFTPPMPTLRLHPMSTESVFITLFG